MITEDRGQQDIGMDESPLARLPPELRNRIYELALTRELPIDVSVNNNYKLPSGPYQASARSGPPTLWVKEAVMDGYLGLTKTCRSIRAETLKLFYAMNSFVFEASADHHTLSALDYFRRAIGEQSAAALPLVIIKAVPFNMRDTFETMMQFRKTVKQLQESAREGGTCAYQLSVEVVWRNSKRFQKWGYPPCERMTVVLDMSDFEKCSYAVEEKLTEKADRSISPQGRSDLEFVKGGIEYCREMIMDGW
ncbi:hypothetical protein LTR85_009308 [Meristemomyces frigidus]|nr:hypothetical protein LTR85_009308 [Meristemomyces frigidus]